MKIMFNQLQTNSGTVNVSFDGGKTTSQYDNDAVRENGIPIPTFNCPGLDKIKISGSNKATAVIPTSTEEIKAQFEVDSVKPDSINLEDLDAYLKSQPANTVDTPYKLNVNFGENPLTDLRNILVDNLDKFVDLSPTAFSGSFHYYDLFKGCENIVKIDLSKVKMIFSHPILSFKSGDYIGYYVEFRNENNDLVSNSIKLLYDYEKKESKNGYCVCIEGFIKNGNQCQCPNGKGFDSSNLYKYLAFFKRFPILDTVCPKSGMRLGWSMLRGNEQLFASKYRLCLPSEAELKAEIEAQKARFVEQHLK